MLFKDKDDNQYLQNYSGSALIEFRGLTKIFKSGHVRNYALDNVDLHLNPKESLSIVGESGSGKSTLGLVAVSLLHPTKGRVYFEGKDISKLRRSGLRGFRRNVQMVFQDPYSALNPFNTIYQSVVAPIKYNWKYYKSLVRTDTLNSSSTREVLRKTVAEMLDRVGLSPGESFLDLYPRKLSGGQRQRVVIARALIIRPKLVIADEPTSMLDVSISAQVLNLLSNLKSELGFSIIYISHEIATARYISDNMAVFNLGRVVEYGPSDEIAFHPKHPYTDLLIRSLMEVGREVISEPPQKINYNVYNGGIKGCTFAHSCPFKRDICVQKSPELQDLGNGHFVACFYPINK